MVIGFSLVLTILVLYAYAIKLTRDVNGRGGCPTCGTPVPLTRAPTSFRQSFWGSWTCTNCSTEIDRRGRKLTNA